QLRLRRRFRIVLGEHDPPQRVPLSSPAPNRIPWASGSSLEKLIVLVWRRMYIFHESLPLSRPPPVSFSPPKAPPISAPLVPVLTLAIPQSLPTALTNFSASRTSFVKIAEVNPCGTPF